MGCFHEQSSTIEHCLAFFFIFAGIHLQHVTEAVLLLCHRFAFILLEMKQYLPMILYTAEQ